MERAVYYIRVSTQEEIQLKALSDQEQEAISAIKRKGWNLVGSYKDEGITGTQAIKRDDYMRLLNDIELDKFDIIVIKSQDRLMRNTKDWYLFVDKLVTHGKRLYMYLEDKFYTPDDALITGIKAILAEEYSRELSKKIKNAHRTRQLGKGKPIITSATWGYDNINKKIVVNEAEAEIVRLIYKLCADGYGSRSIVHELTNRNIYNRTGKEFEPAVCRNIIRNPLYKGTAVMNMKSIDFNTKKTVINPKEEWVFVENAVAPLVSEELWEKANREMDQRARICKTDVNHKHLIGINKGNYDLSSKIFCGLCGNVYWRRRRRTATGKITIYWSCREYVQNGRRNIKDTRGKHKIRVKKKEKSGCDNIHIKDEEIHEVLKAVANDLFGTEKNDVVETVVNLFQRVDSSNDFNIKLKKIEQERSKIEQQKDVLLNRLLDETITNEMYKKKFEEFELRLREIFSFKEDLEIQSRQQKSKEQQLDQIKQLLNRKVADAACVKAIIQHIKKIVVFPNRYEIYFDYMDSIKISLSEETKKKEYLYVNTGKNLTSIDN